MLNMKCKIKINRDCQCTINAILIAFVPSGKEFTRTIGKDGELDKITTDCIVKLESFDKGKLYQIPLDCVEITE